MTTHAHTADYDPDPRHTEPTSALAGPRPRVPRLPDGQRAEDCLQLLARAIQQFHTYPPTSPMCHGAVEAFQRSLATLEHREQLDFRVNPHELIVDEVPVGSGTLIALEIARRLHAAFVAQVTIERAASLRELAHFCFDLANTGDRREIRDNLIEVLNEHGVNRIRLRPAYRPEVLEVGSTPAPVLTVVEEHRAHFEELFAGAPVINHLYPPDKGWVRLDPASPLASVSLVDLALLSDEPAELAYMLLRLTDGAASDRASASQALEQKFSDVATIFGALEPRIASAMFSKLARAVLDLEPGRRQALLRRTILPGLLDGRLDGVVLRDFPDLDLADSLCLLLDLETAAPEVVTTALARLELPQDRQASMVPLIRERLAKRGRNAAPETSVDAHARKLLQIDHGRGRNFAEFAAFDLAVDEPTIDALTRIAGAIVSSDMLHEQLACLWRLTRLQTNPEVVERFAEQVVILLDHVEREGRWPLIAYWLREFRALADALAGSRPDVSSAIVSRLAQVCTTERALRIVELATLDADGRAAANQIIEALGADMGPALVFASQRRQGAAQLLCDHAALFAPTVAGCLAGAESATARIIIRVLGLAGTGYEASLANQLLSPDEQTVREALRALARIGTPLAASLVRAAIERTGGWLVGAGAETLWHFPRPEAHRQVRELLACREFVMRQPQVAARLLDRATQSGATGLEPILTTLASLRYRVWSPALVRVGRRARSLLNQ